MKKVYMFDTDTSSYAVKNYPVTVAQSWEHHKDDDICISAVTKAELVFGAKKRNSPSLMERVTAFLSAVRIVPFDSMAAAFYADIQMELTKNGTPIGDFDAQIASCAMAEKAILVTNNIRHFSKIKTLKVENWV